MVKRDRNWKLTPGRLKPCTFSIASCAFSLRLSAIEGEKYPSVVRPPEKMRMRAMVVIAVREKYGDLIGLGVWTFGA